MACDVSKGVIVKSICELERSTGGVTEEAQRLKYEAARATVQCKRRKAGEKALKQPTVYSLQASLSTTRLRTGCPVLDASLDGGLLARGVVEISGESASGKTQLALQIVAASLLSDESVVSNGAKQGSSWGSEQAMDMGSPQKSCAVFICTESAFPSDRFRQISSALCARSEVMLEDLMSRVLVKACADYETLLETLEKQVHAILATKEVRVLVLDSVAATLRCTYETRKRSEHVERVRRVGVALRRVASLAPHTHVVVVNQVTVGKQPNLSLVEQSWTPALGLTWSSFVATRIALRRTDVRVEIEERRSAGLSVYSTVRLLSVTRSAYLARRRVHFFVDGDGVHGLTRDELAKRGSIALAQLG